VSAILIAVFSAVLAAPPQAASSPLPPCRSHDGRATAFAIRAMYFEDHSPTTWALSLDAEGRMRVVGAGAQYVQVPKSEVARLAATIATQDIWSWPKVRGTPSNFNSLELDVCSAGRRHRVTSYGHTDGRTVEQVDIEFIRLMVRLRRLFSSTEAADLENAEAYLHELRSKVPAR
jgi:hypothetical protein